MIYSYVVSFVLLCFAIATRDVNLEVKYLAVSAAFALAGAIAERNNGSGKK